MTLLVTLVKRVAAVTEMVAAEAAMADQVVTEGAAKVAVEEEVLEKMAAVEEVKEVGELAAEADGHIELFVVLPLLSKPLVCPCCLDH